MVKLLMRANVHISNADGDKGNTITRNCFTELGTVLEITINYSQRCRTIPSL